MQNLQSKRKGTKLRPQHDGMWKALKQKTNITVRNLAQLGIKVDIEVGHRSDRSKNNEIDGRH